MQGALFIISPESFRDEELFVPKEELEGAGWRCVVASRHVGSCSGMRGGHARATLALADVDVADYDVIVFVGGSGAHTYFDDSVALRVAREAEAAGKIVAAICIAPSILARAGVLTGKRATCFVSERSALTAAGAHVESASVVIDGRVVTADGPRAAHDFAAAILRIAAPHRSSGTTQSLRAARDRSGA